MTREAETAAASGLGGILILNGRDTISAVPIRRELRPLYPPHWRALSAAVRFGRAGGRCERCGRPHKVVLRCLPDGRWFDERTGTWRDGRNRSARWPDLIEVAGVRSTRAVLAAAHLNHDPRDNRLRNLHALCQRCHLLHDREYHRAQRWRTLRGRWAIGDLFLGPYSTRDSELSYPVGSPDATPFIHSLSESSRGVS